MDKIGTSSRGCTKTSMAKWRFAWTIPKHAERWGQHRYKIMWPVLTKGVLSRFKLLLFFFKYCYSTNVHNSMHLNRILFCFKDCIWNDETVLVSQVEGILIDCPSPFLPVVHIGPSDLRPFFWDVVTYFSGPQIILSSQECIRFAWTKALGAVGWSPCSEL